ncbi:hypothetical protein LTR05_006260 [Lithohypha guttulata]|uniref:Uncharacterized protein n=1 Tax=Lithohypha guttulata TaxID=1690604 RepID=A0AAN7SWY8_9EURO|nr:hypothetical protein LTR05_006260 [Lithohypha guttulata]
MPAFDDGDLESEETSLKAPPTPPNEPERYGLAIEGIESCLKRPEPAVETNGCIQTGTSTHDSRRALHISNGNNNQRYKDTLSDAKPLSPVVHQPTPYDRNGHIDSGQTSGKGFDYKSWRSNSELGLSPKERRVHKDSSAEKPDNFAECSGPAFLAVHSSSFSEQATDTDGSPYLSSSWLPPAGGRLMQPRSPSISEASGHLSQATQLELNKRPRNLTIDVGQDKPAHGPTTMSDRPRVPRALSTPAMLKSPTALPQDYRKSRASSRTEQVKPRTHSNPRRQLPSPLPASIPLPPLWLSTYLQLELSSQRSSQNYVHRSSANAFPYESSRVKIERLLNFLFLPHQLEGVMWFGVLACLDSWLYTFTILPLRMVKSIYMLSESFGKNMLRECQFVADYVYTGSQRMYRRRRTRDKVAGGTLSRTSSEMQVPQDTLAKIKPRSGKHHRRLKSMPSNLQPDDKADLIKGFLIMATCYVLLTLDASRMYHWVRGQAAIKLYVIYNLLEVCDRLLSAIGQDVLECLFSQEALERKPDGHSKILRPLWLFALALVYSVLHSIALFYQVVTLNVAVNSYSNALITLLMSNQFVEIKGTVFKKFERESLFQVTCADIVERFQLWHMLMIIASRNIVETGGLGIGLPNLSSVPATATTSNNPNITQAAPPLSAASILPRSFMIVPSMLASVSSYVPTITHVLGPFVIVLGSEMLIDWLKHAYINKFNNVKPVIYGRFLDILAKDYYTNAFGEQNLTKRLGLPVIPLSCLMIRAGFQTYQMFVASWVPAPTSSKSATLASLHEQFSPTQTMPTSTAGMLVRKMDQFLNRLPAAISSPQVTTYFTTTLVVLLMFLVLLICKLILGMSLLAYSRARYQSMKHRETSGNPSYHIDDSRRVGGWGVVEVDDDKRRAIYEDDAAGLQALRIRDTKDKARKDSEKERGYSAEGLEKVKRYEMVAKRIW